MNIKKSLLALLLCGGFFISSMGLTACSPSAPTTATATKPNGGDLPDPPKPDPDPDPTPDPDPDPTPDPDPDPTPVYEWRYADILQPTIIVGGISDTVLDKNVQKPFIDIVDRQIDMLAEELVSRIEYIYGTNNINTTHNIKDTTDGSLFSSYSSMNIFSDTITANMSVYNYKDEYVASDGTIMLDSDGEKVLFDSTKHTYYVQENGVKYAAVTSLNVGGLFTSPTAFQYTMQQIGRPSFDMSYPDGYELDSILTLSGAIYGTPTWEYEETYIPYLAYESQYNTDSLTTPWNWANDFTNGTVKDKVKHYLAYIIANDITEYEDLPNESVILASDYDTLLTNISEVNNYVSTYQNLIFDTLTKRMIGTAYEGDSQAGQDGASIALAIDLAIRKMNKNVAQGYFYNGIYRSLYESIVSTDTIRIVSSESNINISNEYYYHARNYKAYDVILKGILRQIAQVDDYQSCLPVSYATQSLSQTQVSSAYAESTDVYFFFKQSINLNSYKIALGVPYDTDIKLTDKNGNTVNYTKEKDDQNHLVITIKTTVNGTSSIPTNLKNIQGYGATSTIQQLLENTNYLCIHFDTVESFTLYPMVLTQVNA